MRRLLGASLGYLLTIGECMDVATKHALGLNEEPVERDMDPSSDGYQKLHVLSGTWINKPLSAVPYKTPFRIVVGGIVTDALWEKKKYMRGRKQWLIYHCSAQIAAYHDAHIHVYIQKRDK